MSDKLLKYWAIVAAIAIICVTLTDIFERKEAQILVSGSISSEKIIIDLPEEWESITKDTLIATRRGNTLILEFKH